MALAVSNVKEVGEEAVKIECWNLNCKYTEEFDGFLIGLLAEEFVWLGTCLSGWDSSLL